MHFSNHVDTITTTTSIYAMRKLDTLVLKLIDKVLAALKNKTTVKN